MNYQSTSPIALAEKKLHLFEINSESFLYLFEKFIFASNNKQTIEKRKTFY